MKETIIEILAITVMISFIIIGYYNHKANKYETLYNNKKIETIIEKDQPIIDKNNIEIQELQKELKYSKQKIIELMQENKQLKVSKSKELEREMKNVKNVKDLCDRFSDLGYPICEPYSSGTK